MTDAKRPLWQWSACDLAEAIAARRVTTVEAVSSVVTRMRETNGKINAVVDDCSEEALRQAEAHDREMARNGPVGPLHGVPVTIKENVDQNGRATPNGVTAFKNVIAPDDAPVVRNLTRAGAIVIGRAEPVAGGLPSQRPQTFPSHTQTACPSRSSTCGARSSSDAGSRVVHRSAGSWLRSM